MLLVSSTPVFLVLFLVALTFSVLLPQEGGFFVSGTQRSNDQELAASTNDNEDAELLYSSPVPEKHEDDVPPAMANEGSLEDFDHYKEPSLDVGTMTVYERVDAAEQFYQEFKTAVEELSQVNVEDFPELEELLQESVEAIEALAVPIADSMHFLRLTAAADSSKPFDDEVGDSLGGGTTSMLPRGRKLLSPSLSATKDGSRSSSTHRVAGRRVSRSEASSRVGGQRKTKKSNTLKDMFGGSTEDYSKNFNPFASIQDDLSNGGDHKKIMKKFIQSLQGEQTTDPSAFSDLLRNPRQDHNMNDDDEATGSRRRLKTKNEKCQQLAECASQMSLFDLFVSFHADDIDPVTGEVDENIVLFDEIDIVAKKARIDSMTNQILQQGETVLCDDLLEEFHRTVEFDGIPQWEGSTISEVCLAEGTTTFVNLASLYEALVPDAFPEEDLVEKLWNKLEKAIQKFMLGGGTIGLLNKIQLFESLLLDAISLPRRKEAFDLVNLLADETVVCAEQLFDSSDRLDNPIFESESTVFSSFAPEVFDDTVLSISPSFGGFGGEYGGVRFDDEDDLAAFGGINRIASVTVYHDSFINGIEVTYLTNDGRTETRLHGSRADSTDTINLSDVVLTQVELRTGAKLDQITFIDSNLRVYGPYGGSGGTARPALIVGDQKGIIAFHGHAGTFVNALGIYSRQKLVFDDYFTKPALAYQLPKGLSTGGVQGRTTHGQITRGSSSPFTFTSTSALLQDYALCLDKVVGPVKGLVQVFERLHDLPSFQNGEALAPCENDPQNPYFICRELNEVGLLPIEDQNPFMCGSEGWVSNDGTFCCSATFCSRLQCGNLCPDTGNLLTKFQETLTRAKCCEGDIRRNAFECSDPTHMGCKIKAGDRWYDIAIRQAREQFLEEIENEKTCASDYFNAIQHGLGLVFGQRRSTPGYVCGIKSAVVDENKSLPGTCCLDAPYELNNEDWGSDYKCSMTCQNLGPYFSGMSEETCDVYGGTWCPQPTDCSTLQTCIADLLVTAQSESRLQAFAMYLGAAPNITDPMDYEQCGETREYFGFDPDFINDAQICDDIEQLRFSRDFTFLEEFLGQGSGMAPSGSPPGTPANTPPGVDGEPEDVPPLELTPPDRTASESTPVQNGSAWAATNFVLAQAAQVKKAVLKKVSNYKCPLDPKFIKANICLKIQNTLIGKQTAIAKLAKLILDISEFTYEELAEIGNVDRIAVLENSDAIFGNMELMATYLQERFMDLNGYIESETDDIRTNMILDTGFLDGRIQLLLDHFNIPSDTRRNRRLEGSKAGSDDEAIDGHQQKQNQEKDLYGADDEKDHHVHDQEEEGQDRRSVSPLLHKVVQIEITSVTHPRSFVCSVFRRDDAGVSPKLLKLEILDIATRTKVPVMLYEVDDLGDGVLLVTIPAVDEDENESSDGASTAVTYFAIIGLIEDGSSGGEVVAKHSNIVSFPPLSVAVFQQ